MPILSLYAFDRAGPDQAGHFWQNHIGHAPGAWAWADLASLQGSQSVLCWERQDDEDVIDLSASANNPLALNQIDALLASPVARNGPVRTSYINWQDTPSGVRQPNPNLHQSLDVLATFNIDFHVHTPWYCSDANGTIIYYVFFFLDDTGNLNADVQGSHYQFDGGGPFCRGNISSGLDAAVPGGIGMLQDLLNIALGLFVKGRTFNMIYFLPGHGDRANASEDNADNNVALAVLPN
jgi:hypothetical protein